MISFLRKELPLIILFLFITIYSIYFSIFTILRNDKMYAHYFDLGIMHQTVYNTYMGMKTGDLSRVLELTNPHDTDTQVKRMSIHNDIFLALLAPFYFIHAGPETLLVIQSIGLAFGAIFVFLIAEEVLGKNKEAEWLGMVFGIAYLLFTPIQRANAFEFHAVTLAVPLILGMYYFFIKKQYRWSLVCIFLALLTKEQVGMVTAFFGGFIISRKIIVIPNSFRDLWLKMLKQVQHDKESRYALLLIIISLIWVILSVAVIIPVSRGEHHFGSDYYGYIFSEPLRVFPVVFNLSTLQYFFSLLAPLGLISLLSPWYLLITAPELGIVLLSNNDNMRNIYFHYHALLVPFIFISAIYGAQLLKNYLQKLKIVKNVAILISIYILSASVLSSYFQSALPYALHPDVFPLNAQPAMVDDMQFWKAYLKDERIPVSSTGHLAPHFTSRRYFYDFSWKYPKATFVLIDTHEVLYGYLKEQTVPAYKALQSDWRYIKIYDKDGLEVYKRLEIL